MLSLIIRRSGIADPEKAWALQIRDYACQGINPDYHTLCYVSRRTAGLIIEAGAPDWLFGKPNDEPPSSATEKSTYKNPRNIPMSD